jgi:signal transduction histidine kinase
MKMRGFSSGLMRGSLPGLGKAGWLLAPTGFAAALLLRARLEAVARAEHELRGPASVLCMACERLRRDPAAQGHAEALDAELARLRAGLADLTAARTGRARPAMPGPVELERLARSAMAGWQPTLASAGRSARVRWRAGPSRITADPGRLAQALGNLFANAAEHGGGPVELRGARTERGVRVEVRNRRPERDTGSDRGPRGGRRFPRGGRRFPRGNRGRGLRIAAGAARSVGGRLEVVPDPDEVVAAIELPVEEADPAPDAA